MDFGSLLNQFQKDVVEAKEVKKRERISGNNNSTNHNKRPRVTTASMNNVDNNNEGFAVDVDVVEDALSFEPIEKIYILCPSKTQTGGPEALHQLCDRINFLVKQQKMKDINNNDDNKTTITSKKTNSDVADTTDTAAATTTTSKTKHLSQEEGTTTTTTTTNLSQEQKQIPPIPTNIKAYMLYCKSNKYNVSYDANARILPCYEDLYKNVMTINNNNDENPLLSYSTPTSRSSSSSSSSNSSRTLLIWPECWTNEMLNYMKQQQRQQQQQKHSKSYSYSPSSSVSSSSVSNAKFHHQCCIWWLSVDNNHDKYQDFQKRNDIIHLYQSEYAKQYLEKHFTKHIYAMTEYISNMPPPEEGQDDDDDDNNNNNNNGSNNQRPIDVIYNPLKGIHYTDEIIKHSSKNIIFQPISRRRERGGGRNNNNNTKLTPKEVRALLKQSKIYIDFGKHPGMDRLPREASLEGCIVITNKEGAAYYKEDIPIPNEYKFHDFNVNKICKLIHNIKQSYNNNSNNNNNNNQIHYSYYTKSFDNYRKWIRNQKSIMDKCIIEFLHNVTTNREKNRAERNAKK